MQRTEDEKTFQASIELFQEQEIRVIECEGERYIPLTDIAQCIGISRPQLTQLYSRNREIIGDDARDIVTLSGDQIAPSTHICFTRDGVIALLSKMDYLRTKSDKKRAAMIAFQIWAKKTLGRAMDNLPAVIHAQPRVTDELRENLEIVRLLNEAIGVSMPTGISLAITHTAERTGVDLFWCRRLLPSWEDLGALTPTEIGRRVGLTPREANNILVEMGMQTKTNRGEYRLTQAGKRYGEAIPYTAKSGHSGYQIQWRDAIINRIENRLYQNRQLEAGITGYL